MNTMQLTYEQDFYLWINKNIELLKQGRFAELDIDILIDELDNMAKRDRRELISRLMILIAHLLKWEFQLSNALAVGAALFENNVSKLPNN